MSNHYHLILSVDPGQADALTDSEVLDKWRQLFPKRKAKLKELKSRPEIEQLQTREILQLRTRLASLSWFMRCLNEPLARIANKEDECTGRFWEGRFKSQLILDEAALLACMAYVDLNPVRASIASTAEDSHYTSIRARLTQEETSDQLVSLNNKKLIGAGYSLNEYLKLLRWTMWSQRSVRASAQKPLDKLSATHGIDTLLELMPKPGGWQRAIGQPGAIKGYAKSIGQRWIKKAA